MTQRILLRDLDIPDIGKLGVYVKHGGYEALRQALTAMKPEEVTEVVKASGLRGRGGAGFPTGVKWSFIPKDIFPRYVAVNADESEPGTFKDRQLIEKNPHQLIEGTALCAYAVRAEKAYIYCRGEFAEPARTLQTAIDEAYKAGTLGKNIFGTGVNIDITVHLGAGAYICGEETALLESLKARSASRDSARRSRLWQVCMPSRPSSTMSRRCRMCRSSSPTARKGIASSGRKNRPAPKSRACRATSSAPAITNSSWARSPSAI